MEDIKTKLELREYFDKHLRDIRNLEDSQKKEFEQKVEIYRGKLDKTIKFYISIFGGILLFIGISGLTGLYIWSRSKITSFIDQKKVSLENEVTSIRGTIFSRLDDEFKKENITILIEDKAKQNEELSNFMLTSFKAQSDDSEAYEQLARWGYNKEYNAYPFRDIACNTYDSIRRSYLERIIPAHRTIMWAEGVNPKMFTYDDFKKRFKDMPMTFHADLVRLIWENENLSEDNKMEFSVAVISGTNTSNSLNAKYFAGNKLVEKMNITWQPFDYGPIIERYSNWEKGTTTTK